MASMEFTFLCLLPLSNGPSIGSLPLLDETPSDISRRLLLCLVLLTPERLVVRPTSRVSYRYIRFGT